MKFDFIIGNPPYQDETLGDNKGYAPPIYHKFLNAAYDIGNHVEMIHPARFLFDAGATPKAWNKKMLEDEHLKVLYYEPDCSKIFPNTDIKGGIAITYRDAEKRFGKIEHFIVFDELRSIDQKVGTTEENSFSQIVFPSEAYRFTKQMYEEYPEVEALLSKGHKYDFKTSILDKLDGKIFFQKVPDDGKEYVGIVGLVKGSRATKYIRKDFVKEAKNFRNYKVFVPKANGSGSLGEVLSTPLIGQPLIGHTQSFISIGNFKTEAEANAVMKYVKTKFARVLLGILKITQDNPPEKWRHIPIQDFSLNSDIDWTQSIFNIDQQLYRKYGLDEKEIEFIETHVKEMK